MILAGHSPIFTHIATTVQGLCSIRAYDKDTYFMSLFEEYCDKFTSVTYLFEAGILYIYLVIDLALYAIFTVCVIAAVVQSSNGRLILHIIHLI